MSQPYVGEIRMFGGNFAPNGWHFCDGTLLPIDQYETLFNLIGTTYGGDGQATFGLPDLRGRIALHQGAGPGITHNYVIGEVAGVESVTLTTNTIPIHNHPWMASTAAASNPSPNSNVLAASATISPFVLDVAGPQLVSSTVQFVGGSQPHDNMMPFLCVNFILSLFGVYPSPS